MGDKTGIEWTDSTWNPTTGCDQVSPGCDHCYALTVAKRMKAAGVAAYQNDGDSRTSGPGFGITMHPQRLDQPLRWTKPRRIFVNSMSDLFHSGVTDQFIAQVFAVMALAPQHQFQLLTKRHGRLRSLLSSQAFMEAVEEAYIPLAVRSLTPWPGWPLPNVWVGVSVEDQQRADLRVPALLDTPAAVRFLSCEPLLGPVDLLGDWREGCEGVGPAVTHSGVRQRVDYGTGVEYDCDHQFGIDWVIVGGESGALARPMHPDWARSLRDQCDEVEVAYLFKQWGEWCPASQGRHEPAASTSMGSTPRGGQRVIYVDQTGAERDTNELSSVMVPRDWSRMARSGKKAAGRTLDGRTHDGYPASLW